MTPRASARGAAPAKAMLRGPDDRRASAADARRKGRRPGPRPATEEVRPASPGRMRKGETPKERGEQTRARIADALIDLLTETELPPTAKEVATRAGVSVRLVFHHFEDMDALYRAVARTQFDRHWRGLGPVAGDLPVGQRVDRTVRQRAKLFDAVAPVRRKAATLALRHRDIAQSFELTNKMLRDWLEETFADELRAAGHERRDLLAALEAAASWETWDRLRRIQGLSSAAARRVVARTLRSLLSA